jgi:hypothetical protein
MNGKLARSTVGAIASLATDPAWRTSHYASVFPGCPSQMLIADAPPVPEFEFIILRLCLTDEVPWDPLPFFQYLFTKYFENEPFVRLICQ